MAKVKLSDEALLAFFQSHPGLKKRQKRFVAELHLRHGADSLDCRSASLLPTTLNRTQSHGFWRGSGGRREALWLTRDEGKGGILPPADVPV